MPFTRRHQVYAVPETAEGVYSAPTPGGLRLVHAPTVTPEYEGHERNIVAESLSMEASEIGRQLLNWNFEVDFGSAGSVGSPAVPVIPLWALFLKSCGMQERRIKSLKIAGTTPTITNTITHGTEIVGGTSGARGRVIGTYTGVTHTKVFYEPMDGVGAAAANLLHFAAAELVSSVEAPAGSFTTDAADLEQDEGYVYKPSDHIVWTATTTGAWGVRIPEPLESILGATSAAWGMLVRPVDALVGATLIRYEPLFGALAAEVIATNIAPFATNTLATVGAPQSNYTLSLASIIDNHLFSARGVRGNWKIDAKSGEPMRLAFEMKGIEQGILNLPSHMFNAPTITSAHRFSSANFSVAALAMRIQQLSFDLGASVAIREDPNFAHGAMSYRVTGRDPGGSIDPELSNLTAHDFWARWAAATVNFAKVRIGTAETALGTSLHNVGSTLWLDIPNAQYDPVTIGDREGVATAAAAFKARRSLWYGEDEVYIYVL